MGLHTVSVLRHSKLHHLTLRCINHKSIHSRINHYAVVGSVCNLQPCIVFCACRHRHAFCFRFRFRLRCTFFRFGCRFHRGRGSFCLWLSAGSHSHTDSCRQNTCRYFPFHPYPLLPEVSFPFKNHSFPSHPCAGRKMLQTVLFSIFSEHFPITPEKVPPDSDQIPSHLYK